MSKCTWREDAEGNWDTDCGNTFRLWDDAPGDNGMAFCCYCGQRLIEVPYTEAAATLGRSNSALSADDLAQAVGDLVADSWAVKIVVDLDGARYPVSSYSYEADGNVMVLRAGH